MKKSTIKRLFPDKKYCIVQTVGIGMKSYWEGGIMWCVDHKDDAKVGTKREMEIILNHELYQAKIRGARVERF